mgnify:CR=1 FL=1
MLSFDRGALRFVGANVAFQWLGMLCNVIFVRAIARLVGAAFADMLTTGVLSQRLLLCLGTVDTTNTECTRQAMAGAAEGLVVISDEQTGGRGRLGGRPAPWRPFRRRRP